MLPGQSNLPRPFGPVKKQRAELVSEKKNGNILGGVEAKWYKARKIGIRFGFRQDCRKSSGALRE
jgi:hypothetical protein